MRFRESRKKCYINSGSWRSWQQTQLSWGKQWRSCRRKDLCTCPDWTWWENTSWGRRQGNTEGFIPIPLNVSKSPLRMPLDLLILVSAFRILLFSKVLYCPFWAVCTHQSERASLPKPRWYLAVLLSSRARGKLVPWLLWEGWAFLDLQFRKEMFQVGKRHIRVLAWVWIALENLSNISLATLKLLKWHNNLHPEF